jgi:hypothetical protein
VQKVPDGFGVEFIFAVEVPIEAAMGQARFLHEVGDADAVGALLPQPHRGLFHDAVVGFLLVFPGIAHARLIECRRSFHNTGTARRVH